MLKLLFILLLSIACQDDCDNIPARFSSYTEAYRIISNAKFNYVDKVNTGSSSWIKEARYYSCDKMTGFFVYKTEKRSYIHQNVPVAVWKGFKEATSFGSYYNRSIKSRYQLSLK